MSYLQISQVDADLGKQTDLTQRHKVGEAVPSYERISDRKISDRKIAQLSLEH